MTGILFLGKSLSESRAFSLPGKKKLQSADYQMKVIVVDVTETPIERPKKTRTAKFAREADSQELLSKHRDCDESEVAQYDGVVVFVNQSVRRAKCQHKLVPNLLR